MIGRLAPALDLSPRVQFDLQAAAARADLDGWEGLGGRIDDGFEPLFLAQRADATQNIHPRRHDQISRVQLVSIQKWLFSPISALGENFNPRNMSIYSCG